MFQFNPFLFGLGEWADIENIRATFDYGTGEVIAEIVKNEEAAMNKATAEIAEHSKEQLAVIKKAENTAVNTAVSELNKKEG